MNLRLLTIETRRNVGLLLFPIILAVPWYILKVQTWQSFLWVSTNEMLQKSVIPFAAPAMAGAATWMGGRSRRRGIEDLLATTSCPATVRQVTLWMATALWGVLAYMAVAAVMMGQTALQATWGGPTIWPVVIVIAALMAHTTWGFFLGGFLPSRFTTPLVAIGAFGLQQLAGNHMQAVSGGWSTTWVTYLAAHNPASNLAPWQAMFYLGLASAALAAIALGGCRSVLRWTAFAGATALAIAGIVMMWGAFPRWDAASQTLHDGWGKPIGAPTRERYTPVCKGTPVSVCAHPAYTPLLDEAVVVANALVQPLLRLPEVPLRVEETDAGPAAGPDKGSWLDVSRFADKLVADPGSLPGGRLTNEAQIAMRSWLLQRAGLNLESGCYDSMSQEPSWDGGPSRRTCRSAARFARLDPAQQRAWLVEHYGDLRLGKLKLEDLP